MKKKTFPCGAKLPKSLISSDCRQQMQCGRPYPWM